MSTRLRTRTKTIARSGPPVGVVDEASDSTVPRSLYKVCEAPELPIAPGKDGLQAARDGLEEETRQLHGSSEWHNGVEDLLTDAYPSSTIDPELHLSLEALCRQYPNCLRTHHIDRFLRAKWDAQDICTKLPQPFRDERIKQTLAKVPVEDRQKINKHPRLGEEAQWIKGLIVRREVYLKQQGLYTQLMQGADSGPRARAHNEDSVVSSSAKRPREEDHLDEPTARRPPPITARSEALDPALSRRGSFNDPTGDRPGRAATPVQSFGITRVTNSQIRGVLHGAHEARKQRQLAQALEAGQVPAPATVSTSTQQGVGLAPSTAAVVPVIHNPPVSSTAGTAYPTTAGAAQGIAVPQQEPKTKPHNGHRLGRDGPIFPHHPHCDTPVPPQFTLGQICQLFPLCIKDEVLKDFFRHGWTPEDIFARWPQDVQQQVNLSYTNQNKHRVMKNRFSKLKKALISNGQHDIWMASPPRRFDDRQGTTALVPTVASIAPLAANAPQPAINSSKPAPMVAVQPLRRQDAQTHATTFAPAFSPNGPKYPHPGSLTRHGLLAPPPSTTNRLLYPDLSLSRSPALVSQPVSTPGSSLPAAGMNRQQQQLRRQMPDMSANIMPMQPGREPGRNQGPTFEIQRMRGMNPQLQPSMDEQVRHTPIQPQDQQLQLQVAPRQAQAQTWTALDQFKHDYENAWRSGGRTIAAPVGGAPRPQQLNYVAHPPERQEVHRPDHTIQGWKRQRFEAAVMPTFGNLPREAMRQQEGAQQQEAAAGQFRLQFPDSDLDEPPFYNRLFPPRPTEPGVLVAPVKPPKPLRPTKVSLELAPDQRQSFNTTSTAEVEYRSDLVSIVEKKTLQDTAESSDESDLDGPLPGGVTMQDLEFMCTDFEHRQPAIQQQDTSGLHSSFQRQNYGRQRQQEADNASSRRLALEQQGSIRPPQVGPTSTLRFDDLFLEETGIDLDADRALPIPAPLPKYADFGHDANEQVAVLQGDHDTSASSHKTNRAANDLYDSGATIDDPELPQDEQQSAAAEDDDDDLWVSESKDINGEPSGWKRAAVTHEDDDVLVSESKDINGEPSGWKRYTG